MDDKRGVLTGFTAPVPPDWTLHTDFPTIVFSVKSVEMPFGACAVVLLDSKTGHLRLKAGEPKLPPGMRKLLHEDFMKSFDS
ncbi:hypothetical protein GGX14DRAFT_571731 [Mycena pura]|uniref:Uncharacterized protein n=1 Tax=Mycena pura TaxID=153505 RepID=A0AAD6VA06_9AGAR|nr:hypothetical protein GGX14DRAFT_571731 [Mycena pura]